MTQEALNHSDIGMRIRCGYRLVNPGDRTKASKPVVAQTCLTISHTVTRAAWKRTALQLYQAERVWRVVLTTLY